MSARRPIIIGLILAAGFLAFAGLVAYARNRGLIEADFARRAVQVVIGLGLAAYANLIPKSPGPFRSPAASRRIQAALRLSGWAFTLAGLAYAALWIWTPVDVADVASTVVVAAAMIVTLGAAAVCIAARMSTRADLPQP